MPKFDMHTLMAIEDCARTELSSEEGTKNKTLHHLPHMLNIS